MFYMQGFHFAEKSFKRNYLHKKVFVDRGILQNFHAIRRQGAKRIDCNDKGPHHKHTSNTLLVKLLHCVTGIIRLYSCGTPKGNCQIIHSAYYIYNIKIVATRIYFIATAVYWPQTETGEEVKVTALLGMGGEGPGGYSL